jgi:hypothetical protein
MEHRMHHGLNAHKKPNVPRQFHNKPALENPPIHRKTPTPRHLINKILIRIKDNRAMW